MAVAVTKSFKVFRSNKWLHGARTGVIRNNTTGYLHLT